MTAGDGPKIFLIAGEPSGDALGARLMAALRDETKGKVRFCGVGGPSMEAEGLKSLFPMRELTVMGVAEVLPHLPNLLRRIRQTVDAIQAESQDAVITIDCPTFANRVMSRLQDRKAVRIHYVAPSVWAWRPWRVHKYKRNYDHILALLPFEPPFFEKVGLPCHHVGHPVIEYGAGEGDGAGFRDRHRIAPDEIVLCVLPGSRRSEVGRLAPVFGEALELLKARGYRFRVFVPTVDTVSALIRDIVGDWPGNPEILVGSSEKYDLMAASNAALAASGTVSLELALARVPTVIAYRVAWLTAQIVRPLLKVKFANLINIILDRAVVPEQIQQFCTADALANDLEHLLSDQGRDGQLAAVAPALELLGRGGELPSKRAAKIVLDIIDR